MMIVHEKEKPVCLLGDKLSTDAAIKSLVRTFSSEGKFDEN